MSNYLTFAEFKSRTIMQPGDVDRLVRIRWEKVIGDTLAATPTPETRFGEVVIAGTIAFVLVTTLGAVVADPTNYATITVSKRTAGGAPTVIASLDTTTTSLPAGIPIALPVTAGAVLAEDVLTISIAKAGAGVLMPSLSVDVRPSPNFFDVAASSVQAHVESRLRKRYVIPLDQQGPVPEAVKRWMTVLLTQVCFWRRGHNPASEQDQTAINASADTVNAEIKEAADSKDGLFELPLIQGDPDDAEGVAKGSPLSYSEQSPYVAFDKEICAGIADDQRGSGS